MAGDTHHLKKSTRGSLLRDLLNRGTDWQEDIVQEFADERRRSMKNDTSLIKIHTLIQILSSSVEEIMQTIKVIEQEEPSERALRLIRNIETESSKCLLVLSDTTMLSAIDFVSEHQQIIERELCSVRTSESMLQSKLREMNRNINNVAAQHVKEIAAAKREVLHQSIKHLETSPTPEINSDKYLSVVACEIDGEDTLWNDEILNPETSVESLRQYQNTILMLLQQHTPPAFEYSIVGGSCIVIFQHPHQALKFACDLQRALLDINWLSELLSSSSQFSVLNDPDSDVVVLRGIRSKIAIDTSVVYKDMIEDCSNSPINTRVVYHGSSLLRSKDLARIASGGEILLTSQSQDSLRYKEGQESIFNEINVTCLVKDCTLINLPENLSDEVIYSVILPELSHRRELVKNSDRETKVENLRRTGCITGRGSTMKVDGSSEGDDGNAIAERYSNILQSVKQKHIQTISQYNKREEDLISTNQQLIDSLKTSHQKLEASMRSSGYGPSEIRDTLESAEPDDDILCRRPRITAIVNYLTKLSKHSAPPRCGQTDWRIALSKVPWLGLSNLVLKELKPTQSPEEEAAMVEYFNLSPVTRQSAMPSKEVWRRMTWVARLQSAKGSKKISSRNTSPAITPITTTVDISTPRKESLFCGANNSYGWKRPSTVHNPVSVSVGTQVHDDSRDTEHEEKMKSLQECITSLRIQLRSAPTPYTSSQDDDYRRKVDSLEKHNKSISNNLVQATVANDALRRRVTLLQPKTTLTEQTKPIKEKRKVTLISESTSPRIVSSTSVSCQTVIILNDDDSVEQSQGTPMNSILQHLGSIESEVQDWFTTKQQTVTSTELKTDLKPIFKNISTNTEVVMNKQSNNCLQISSSVLVCKRDFDKPGNVIISQEDQKDDLFSFKNNESQDNNEPSWGSAIEEVCEDYSSIATLCSQAIKSVEALGPGALFSPQDVFMIRNDSAKKIINAITSQQSKLFHIKHSLCNPVVVDTDNCNSDLVSIDIINSLASQISPSSQISAVSSVLRCWKSFFDYIDVIISHFSKSRPPLETTLRVASNTRNPKSLYKTRKLKGILGRYQLLTSWLEADPSSLNEWSTAKKRILKIPSSITSFT